MIDIYVIPIRPIEEWSHGWIYVLQGWDAEGKAYKIGRTANEPSIRLAQFVPKLPFEAKLILTYECLNMVAQEHALHARFADKRTRGEWFKLDSEDLALISAHAMDPEHAHEHSSEYYRVFEPTEQELAIVKLAELPITELIRMIREGDTNERKTDT